MVMDSIRGSSNSTLCRPVAGYHFGQKPGEPDAHVKSVRPYNPRWGGLIILVPVDAHGKGRWYVDGVVLPGDRRMV